MKSISADPIWLAPLAGAAIGLAELAALALLGPSEPAKIPSAAAFTLVAYGLLGLVIAGGLRMLNRFRSIQSAGGSLELACVLAASTFLAVMRLLDSSLTHRLEIYSPFVAGLVACAIFGLARRLLTRLTVLTASWTWALILALSMAGLMVSYPYGDNVERNGTAPDGTPSVLLVTIDTLRADFLSAYGRESARTPVMDELARGAFRFDNVVAHSILTGPSHLSILSGLLPHSHGIYENAQRAPASVATLAEQANSHGLATAAFVAGAPVSEAEFGLLSRFSYYDDDFRTFQALPKLAFRTGIGHVLAHFLEVGGHNLNPLDRKADAVTRAALRWFGDLQPGPFFVWTHYYDPHLPYEAPDRFLVRDAQTYQGPAVGNWYRADADARDRIIHDQGAMDQMARLYEAEIAHVDHELGRLIAEAGKKAGPGGLWIFVTADHGESFGEHGIYFWRDLYEPSLRVPLIVRPPVEGGTKVVTATVGLIDIAPTIQEVLGLRPAEPVDGRSLLPLMYGEDEEEREELSLTMPTRAWPYDRQRMSTRRGQYKAIWRAPGWGFANFLWLGEEQELYDLSVDPAELHNLASSEPELYERLIEASRNAGAVRRDVLELTPEQLRRLRALGYVQ